MELAPKRAGFAPERINRITEHLDKNYIAPGKIAGCQTLVARHGHVAYFKSQGLMDRERRKPVTDDTIFRLYSMTKPITSVALMTLFEQGHFQLNDPVSRFIPAWRDHKVWVSGEGPSMETAAPARPMSMRHVLSHTGGLTYGATNHPVDRAYREVGVGRGAGETLGGFADKLAKVPLRYQPGERWMYSLSTDVCGYLVEVISGKRFDQYLQETIFDPLDMKDTSFMVAQRKADRLAANYERQADKSLKLIDDPERSNYLKQPTFFSGGGGLTGTTADYLRFCEMLRRGGELDGVRILGPRTIELMHLNHLAGGKDLSGMAVGAFSETAYEGVGFGLGFAMTLGQVEAGALGGGDYYWGGAASTIFWVDPKEDMVVIFMTQLMPSATFNFRGQLRNIIYSAIVE
ncbi:MAG: serine hydrolase domain-containing protein [Candidatus Binatus sp.]|jgi:CubicO group peptidase (beta-lactamase class C family)|uniref:serine hydrolase domain-containing protein n=1 Tax=Candidatus Binatus sp. TaxID=2811406 RepID=UPI003C73AF9F